MARLCGAVELATNLETCLLINVSLDTLDEQKFLEIIWRGRRAEVLDGIDAAAQSRLMMTVNMMATHCSR